MLPGMRRICLRFREGDSGSAVLVGRPGVSDDVRSRDRRGSVEYVALLRGINVGGNNKVVMSELREQVAAEGFANVRTYVNSGNLLFEAEADVPP